MNTLGALVGEVRWPVWWEKYGFTKELMKLPNYIVYVTIYSADVLNSGQCPLVFLGLKGIIK